MTHQYQLGDYVRIHDHDGTEITVKISDSGIPNRQGDFTFKAGARMFKNSEILGLGEVPVVSEKLAKDLEEQWALMTPAPDTEVQAEPQAENERARILSTAKKLINGDRADAYGEPKENFGRIAALWNAQLGKKLSEPLTAEDVAYALVQLKMSRLANTPGHEDSLVDVAGYIALAGELK